MWLLILIAVHVNNPADIPASLQMTFPTEAECISAKDSLTYWVKFDWFKVTAKCQKKS